MLTTTVVLLLLGSVSSSELPVDSPDGVQELNGHCRSRVISGQI